MKYLNQKKYPHIPYITRTDPDDPGHERGKNTTVRTSGCGLCAGIMAADRLLPYCEFSLRDAVELSYEVGANHGRGTDPRLYYPAFAQRMGLKLESSKDIADLQRCLRTGGAAVILFAGDYEGHVGLFTHGGHYVTAINEEPDGRIALLDPSYFVGKYEEEGRQGKVEVINEVIALCSPEIIEEETAPKQLPYWLFWRR